MPSHDDWADAYLKQAKHEWSLWLRFREDETIPVYLQLHLLQMATEKLGKSYRLRAAQTSIKDATSKHIAFEKAVGALMSARGKELFPEAKSSTRQWIHRHLQGTAREIDLLCPAVDKDNTKRNSEYPWESGGQLFVPVDFDYPSVMGRLDPPSIVRFLKVINAMFADAEGGSRA